MNSTGNRTAGAGALFMLVGVALGAFGTHSLRGLEPRMLEIWQTGVQYHLIHALAILYVSTRADRRAAWFFGIGILIFSGSLYALAVTGTRVLGAITPIGGACFLGGWFWLATQGFRRSKE